MRTEICDQLGIEFPIFAFSHCRDVVAAVTNAGGLGVLGAVAFSAEQLEVELQWIDEHTGGKPYGVDIVIPGKYEGMDELDPAKLEADLLAAVPQQHRDFAEAVLADHDVPQLPQDDGPATGTGLLGWTAATASPLVDVAQADAGPAKEGLPFGREDVREAHLLFLLDNPVGIEIVPRDINSRPANFGNFL